MTPNKDDSPQGQAASRRFAHDETSDAIRNILNGSFDPTGDPADLMTEILTRLLIEYESLEPQWFKMNLEAYAMLCYGVSNDAYSSFEEYRRRLATGEAETLTDEQPTPPPAPTPSEPHDANLTPHQQTLLRIGEMVADQAINEQQAQTILKLLGQGTAEDEDTAEEGGTWFFGEGNTVAEFIEDMFTGSHEHRLDSLFAFTDYLLKFGSEPIADDLEELRFRLFQETATAQAAYKLLINRYQLPSANGPEKLINDLIERYCGDKQKGGER